MLAGKITKHQRNSIVGVRMSPQDADQTARRHCSVIWVVRQSQGMFTVTLQTNVCLFEECFVVIWRIAGSIQIVVLCFR